MNENFCVAVFNENDSPIWSTRYPIEVPRIGDLLDIEFCTYKVIEVMHCFQGYQGSQYIKIKAEPM